MQTMREDAETILREAVAAAQPGRLVREALAAERLTGRIVLLAAGKAAWAMAQAACACVPVRRGIVITKDGHLGGTLPPLELAEAGHPVPDARAFAAARRALALTQGLTAEDTVLVLLSGGASALFELPLVPEARLREITQRLLRSGADIAAMNAVRKRLSAVKGGRFAQHCAPARVVSILLSDVLGDRPDVIGSGPAVPDPSTSGEALEAAGQAGLLPDAALEALLRQVGAYAGRIRLHTVPFTHIQEEIGRACPEELFTLVMRRFMMKIATRVAKSEDCGALVTGESVDHPGPRLHRRGRRSAGVPPGHRDGQRGDHRHRPENRHV